MIHPNRVLPIIILFLCTLPAFGGSGDIRHVVPFNRIKVTTDPSKGVNTYKQWAVFPTGKLETRKVVLSITYRCPDGLHCGEWDYIDHVMLARIGGAAARPANIEVARLISPYGWKFDSTWHFTWQTELTDVAALLHDSVEIQFDHTGYESNADRGWLITLDFAVTEGRPSMQWVGMDTLWHGSIAYGDTLKSFDELVPAIHISNSRNAQVARLWIMQTGHGMDDAENCAEFCSKYRQVFFDDSLIDARNVWRRCGTNPLFPQGGTWIYDRANWCPGSIVAPDLYDVPLGPRKDHTVRLSMQPYVNRKHPSASYYLYSYLFYYMSPWAENDVSLEGIIAPGTGDEFSRMNPVCANPRILVKNNGKLPLTSFVVKFGLSGGEEQSYRWEGSLDPQKKTEVTIPAVLPASEGTHQFSVRLDSPNGKRDEYPEDNAGQSEMVMPPVYGNTMVLVVMTNHDSSSLGYQLVDETGAIVHGHKIGAYRANTVYRDTLHLKQGCYQLMVMDTLGDGLDFWANPEGGYGYVRLLDLNGRLLKAFGSDFGSEINYSFTVADGFTSPVEQSALPLVNPFPIRNPGKFSVELFFNDPQPSTTLSVTTEDGSKTVFTRQYPNIKESIIPVDVTDQPDGFYYLKVTSGDKTVSRKFKIKHKG